MDRREPVRKKATRTAAITRSGLRRYPRVLAESVARPTLPIPVGDVADLRGLHEHDPLAAAWLGHASALLRLDGMTIAVDPVFSHRVGPKIGPFTFGPHRAVPAPVTPDLLPPVDLLLVTHAHFDHLDRPTLKALASDKTTVVTARGCRRLIPRGFANVVELDYGQADDFGTVNVAALPTKHWGARAVIDRNRGCNAYALTADAARVFVSGDTALTAAFDHLEDMDLAVFSIGAYDPWEHKHATPEQVWAMFTRMGARSLLPVHHSTFELSEEKAAEPMARLLAAAGDDAARVIDAPAGALWVPPSLRDSETDAA
ncbi:MAG: MBL fold metallo-hydrolase [Phycisphaerales bacterium]